MTRIRSIADVIPISACEPDGLLITTDGSYVRLINAEHVLQPLRGRAHRDEIRARLATLASRIPSGQQLQILVEAEPLDPDQALTRDWQHTHTAATAAEQRGEGDLAEAMLRLGYGLEQTIRRSAPIVDAVAMRWTLATTWTPANGWRAPQRRRRGRAVAPDAHERAADASLRFTEQIAGELQAAGAHAELLDGPAALTNYARCLNPTQPPNPDAIAAVPQVLQATDPAAALEHRAAIVDAIANTAELTTSARDWITRDDGSVEAILHLTTPPLDTSLWWLMYLMETPPPWRLSVFLAPGDRVRQRRAFKLRHRRIWADLRNQERRNKLVTHDAYEREDEAADIAAELRATATACIYDTAVYFAVRDRAGDTDRLTALTTALAKDFEAFTDARLYSGAFLTEAGLISTLPGGTDRARTRVRFAQRNIADCIPLLSTTATARDGVPLGYALPGQTLERVDLFDPGYRTFVTLVTGASGSGKTVGVNALLSRNLARGATGYIIDRSSSEDEGGSTRSSGHYEQIAALIPGARVVHFGAGAPDEIICPWDITDPANVPVAKTKFLVALHALLIGDTHGEHHQLDGMDRTQLERGIDAVYARCSTTGEQPREQLLYQELKRLAREQDADATDGDSTVASVQRRLAERLHPYIEGGAAAWIADRPTTLTGRAPLVLFDLAGLPDDLAAPVMLTLVERIERDVARGRAEHVAGHNTTAGPWAGRAFVVIDEAWKALESPAAGAWLNEWARRTRHLECAVLAVTQHLPDFANNQGHALLRNSVLRILFRTAHDELEHARDALGFADEDLAAIAALETRKGEYSTAYLDSEAHGRTTVRVYLGDMEYWTASADPHRDQPVRQRALKEANGDAWGAMRLLVDPAWHKTGPA